MRAAWTPALVTALVLGGCTGAEPQGTVLGNPKVLLDRAADNATRLYVHSAFGERAYDRIAVRIDNETVAEENDTYALTYRTPDVDFHLGVEASAGEEAYAFAALVRAEETEEGAEVEVALLGDDGFGEFRPVDLPWQKIVDAAPEEDL